MFTSVTHPVREGATLTWLCLPCQHVGVQVVGSRSGLVSRLPPFGWPSASSLRFRPVKLKRQFACTQNLQGPLLGSSPQASQSMAVDQLTRLRGCGDKDTRLGSSGCESRCTGGFCTRGGCLCKSLAIRDQPIYLSTEAARV